MSQNFFTSHDGLRIAYYVDDFTPPWTKPETLVLLHAAMGSSQRFFSWVPDLARHYRVVRMDLRGHGASQMPTPEQPFSLDLLVADFLQLLEVVGSPSVHLVGNSAGGYVSQQVAMHHAGKLKSLALFGSTPGLKNSHAPTWIPKIQAMGLRNFLAATIAERFDETVDPNLREWFCDQAGSNDPAFMARFILHMASHDWSDQLASIRVPTLIVAAGKEQIGHASAYDDMQAKIAGSKLVLLDTSGHNICDGYPQRCVQELLTFLRSQ